MAISNFYMDWDAGYPPIAQEEVIYFNAEIGDLDGSISALKEVTDTQAHVKAQINSSPEKLHALKSDPRVEWIEDIGWVDTL